jgi:hypothetical protein
MADLERAERRGVEKKFGARYHKVRPHSRGIQFPPNAHSPVPSPLSPFPIPHSPFPIPHSPFPIPHSPFPIPRCAIRNPDVGPPYAEESHDWGQAPQSGLRGSPLVVSARVSVTDVQQVKFFGELKFPGSR